MSHGRVKHRRTDERGAAALEFALIVPILIALVFGIADFGWAINRDTMVNNAAREGAREGSLNPDATAIATTVRESLAQVEAIGTTPSKITVTVTCRKPDNSACASFATDAVSGGTVIVTVALDHSWITPVGSTFGSGIVLRKTVEMRIE
ncbi:MAG: pilus assembly protein [Propionibacteriales bacterium]|nr:pilus assembly protein [Propionibacteriales bacterium]